MKRFYGVFLLACCTGFFSFAEPIPLGMENLDLDPLCFSFEKGMMICRQRGEQKLIVPSDSQMAKRVNTHIRFCPKEVKGDSWSIAGLAVIQDSANYWRLALVCSPREKGGKHFFELAEMRNGIWLSHTNLKIAEDFNWGEWRLGVPYDFHLTMEPTGVRGEIKDAKTGKSVFRRKYLFNAPAVTMGAAGMSVAGITGTYSRMDAEIAEPVPVRKAEVKSFPAYTCEGNAPKISDRATGFFHVIQKDGRWWVIDPKGKGTVLLGIDHVTFRGHWCEKMKKFPHWEKNKKKYAAKAEWEKETLGRLKRWGFNFLGAGCDPDLRHRGFAHTAFLSLGDRPGYMDEEFWIAQGEYRPCSAFPNVFHPLFQRYCEFHARRICAPMQKDPWLFGYFIDNELAWWGRGTPKSGLVDQVMLRPASHTAKIALRDFLSARAKGDLKAFNKFWGTHLKSWDDFLSLKALSHDKEEQILAAQDFLKLAAERYFGICSAAIRKADPNHLVMGARFAGTQGMDPVVWETAGKYCDVVTFNCYPWADLDRNVMMTSSEKDADVLTEHFTKYYNYAKRPILITEWSFPALDSGLPCIHGAGQRFDTQKQRTRATSLFARTMLSLPFLLGYDYFMWVDQPALGISSKFPEDSNYGLINEDGVPYPEITGMFTELHRDVVSWRMRPAPDPIPASEVPSPKVMRPQKVLTVLAKGGKTDFVRFFREGNSYRMVSPAGVEFRGALGKGMLIPSVLYKGANYGAYNALLESAFPKKGWFPTDELIDLQYRSESGNGVLELTGRRQQKDFSFEITHRVTLLKDRPVFLCEFLSMKNIGKEPFPVRSLFFRFHSGAVLKNLGNLPGVPNLWKHGAESCWLDQTTQRYYGAYSPFGIGLRIHFWTDSCQHPDAYYVLPEALSLNPGEIFSPKEPLYCLGILGEGGGKSWMETKLEIQRLTTR